MKTHKQKKPGRKGFIRLTYPESQSTEGSQGSNSNWAGICKQELIQRPWGIDTYWLATHGLLSLLSFRSQDQQPTVALPTMGWAFVHHLIIKNMPYKLICLQPDRLEALPQKIFPYSQMTMEVN